MIIRAFQTSLLALCLASCGDGGDGGTPGNTGVTNPTPSPTPTPTPSPTPTPASVLSILHVFSLFAGDSAQPNGPVMQADDGNLYGVTKAGGANQCGRFRELPCGTIFKLTLTGQADILYSFGADQDDGFFPVRPPIQGADGALYGLTASGGTVGGGGTAYRIALDGTYSQLYSFGIGPNDGYNPDGSLVLANDGNYYGTTDVGGTHNRGTVFRMTPNGAVTFLYSFTATAIDGWQPNGNLVQGADGTLYGMTSNGGQNGAGTVFKISLNGEFSNLHHFGATNNDPIAPLGGLLLASDGNFYGTTASGGGQGQGTVFMMTPAGQVTVIYRFGANISNRLSDGDGPNAQLFEGSDGFLYGTTNSGGVNECSRCGILFRISKTGSKETLFSFGPLLENPADPDGGVIQASDGAFYGILEDNANVGSVGAFSGFGAVFRYGPPE